ncbi:MAG: hypothetical protein C5B50_02370 [Verrucomicrobia bacterium]|nr:MAG: hypothetical protein C5B50_02370 [Verrucomicrobiota bacterium]
MTEDEIFSIWAPDESLWSCWVKPVLFAHMDSPLSHLPTVEPEVDVHWAPVPEQKHALVLDLPGSEGVWVALALAARGYRPVPLYNAVPVPFSAPIYLPAIGKAIAAVDVMPTLSSLRTGAGRLAHLSLASDAPPIFLLDANRQGDGRKMQPHEFDNRSVCFTTDFPSANYLLAQGIRRVLLVQRGATYPREDLSHILRRWQDAGLVIDAMRMESPGQPEHIEVARPSWYRAMFQRALAAIGLRRARGGGFGAWVPDPSAGG